MNFALRLFAPFLSFSCAIYLSVNFKDDFVLLESIYYLSSLAGYVLVAGVKHRLISSGRILVGSIDVLAVVLFVVILSVLYFTGLYSFFVIVVVLLYSFFIVMMQIIGAHFQIKKNKLAYIICLSYTSSYFQVASVISILLFEEYLGFIALSLIVIVIAALYKGSLYFTSKIEMTKRTNLKYNEIKASVLSRQLVNKIDGVAVAMLSPSLAAIYLILKRGLGFANIVLDYLRADIERDIATNTIQRSDSRIVRFKAVAFLFSISSIGVMLFLYNAGPSGSMWLAIMLIGEMIVFSVLGPVSLIYNYGGFSLVRAMFLILVALAKVLAFFLISNLLEMNIEYVSIIYLFFELLIHYTLHKIYMIKANS